MSDNLYYVSVLVLGWNWLAVRRSGWVEACGNVEKGGHCGMPEGANGREGGPCEAVFDDYGAVTVVWKKVGLDSPEKDPEDALRRMPTISPRVRGPKAASNSGWQSRAAAWFMR